MRTVFLLPSWFCIVMLSMSEAPSAEPLPGALSGTVRFTGVVPPDKKIMTSDGGTILHNDLVVEPKSKGLRYVFVTLENAPPQSKLEKAKPIIVDQRDWIFVPRVVAVQHGQATQFENSDQVNHSVQAFSINQANEFNAIAGPGQPIVHTFEPQSRPVMIGCALHPWMRAWVFVVQHPWFAVTDATGSFRIDKIPPGPYTLVFVHQDANLREKQSVRIETGKTTEVNLNWQKRP